MSLEVANQIDKFIQPLVDVGLTGIGAKIKFIGYVRGER